MSTSVTHDVQQIERTILSNGLCVVTERLHNVRSVSMGIWIANGSRREDAGENGITHFVEHMVFKGTTNRSAEEIARSMDSIGGHMDAFTSKETVCFSAKVLDEHLPIAFEVLSDLVLNPLFREVDIERERGVIEQEIKMDEDNPDYLVHEIFTQNFWKDHPLGRPILGTADTVAQFNQEKLFRYYRSCFTPDNIVVAAAGNLEHARVVDLARQWLGSMPGLLDGQHQAPPDPNAHLILHHKKQLEQVQVYMGLPSTSLLDQRRYAWSVLNTLLGGGMSSRLFQNIRERQGLAYAVFSDINPYRDAGVFSIYAGTSAETVPQVVSSVLHELRVLRENPVPADELRRAKDNLKGSLMLSLESTGSRMSNLARQQIYFNRYIGLSETADRIEAITAGDIAEITAEAFDPNRLALTVLGNIDGLQLTRADLHE